MNAYYEDMRMPKVRQFASMTKGSQLLFIQTEQMDKVSGANKNEVLSNMVTATSLAMKKISSEEQGLLDMSLKYVCDVEVSGGLVKFNVLIPMSMKYQVEGMPRSYKVYPISMPLTKSLFQDIKDQAKDPDYTKSLYIKKITSQEPIPFLLDQAIAVYRNDVKTTAAKKVEKAKNKHQTEVKAQHDRDAARLHSQNKTGDEDTFLLSEFTGVKEEKEQTAQAKPKTFMNRFRAKKESDSPVAPDKTQPKEVPAVELTDLQKLMNKITDLEHQLSKFHTYKTEYKEIKDNIDDIKTHSRTNQIDSNEFVKQMALLQCVQEKINCIPLQHEVTGLYFDINAANANNKKLETEIEDMMTNGGISTNANKKKLETETESIMTNSGISTASTQETVETDRITPFDIIANTMSKIDSSPVVSAENMSENVSAMQQDLRDVVAPSKLRETALSLLKQNAYLAEKKEMLASPQHMQTLQLHMCNKLYNSLLDQLDAWSQDPPLFGMNVRHQGKIIKVPEGMGKMLIALNPDAHKPHRLGGIFTKRSNNLALTGAGRPMLTIEPNESLKILSQCQKIAEQRLEKSSLDKRLELLDNAANQRQDNNLQILVATSHIKLSAVKSPQKIMEAMNEYDKKLGKLTPLVVKDVEKTAKIEKTPLKPNTLSS